MTARGASPIGSRGRVGALHAAPRPMGLARSEPGADWPREGRKREREKREEAETNSTRVARARTTGYPRRSREEGRGDEDEEVDDEDEDEDDEDDTATATITYDGGGGGGSVAGGGSDSGSSNNDDEDEDCAPSWSRSVAEYAVRGVSTRVVPRRRIQDEVRFEASVDSPGGEGESLHVSI